MGILWKYYKAFFSSFLPSYTIRRYHICSHYFNDFRKMIKNRIKVSHVTPGHYGRPFRNINIYFFAFMFGWYLGNFVNFLKFWFHISKFDEFKSSIWMTFSLTSNFSLFVPASRKGYFLALPATFKQKNSLWELFEYFKPFFMQKPIHIRQDFWVGSVKKKT